MFSCPEWKPWKHSFTRYQKFRASYKKVIVEKIVVTLPSSSSIFSTNEWKPCRREFNRVISKSPQHDRIYRIDVTIETVSVSVLHTRPPLECLRSLEVMLLLHELTEQGAADLLASFKECEVDVSLMASDYRTYFSWLKKFVYTARLLVDIVILGQDRSKSFDGEDAIRWVQLFRSVVYSLDHLGQAIPFLIKRCDALLGSGKSETIFGAQVLLRDFLARREGALVSLWERALFGRDSGHDNGLSSKGVTSEVLMGGAYYNYTVASQMDLDAKLELACDVLYITRTLLSCYIDQTQGGGFAWKCRCQKAKQGEVQVRLERARRISLTGSLDFSTPELPSSPLSSSTCSGIMGDQESCVDYGEEYLHFVFAEIKE